MVYCVKGFRKIYHQTPNVQVSRRLATFRTIKAAIVLPVGLYANSSLSRLCVRSRTLAEIHRAFAQPLNVASLHWYKVCVRLCWPKCTVEVHKVDRHSPFRLQLLRDLHTGTTSRVRVNGCTSEPFLTTLGIRHGTCSLAFLSIHWLEHCCFFSTCLDYSVGNDQPATAMQYMTLQAQLLLSWAAQPRGVGGQCPPLLGPAGYRGYRGRSNENDLCFYSRQSLFSTVQVTEFQFPWL